MALTTIDLVPFFLGLTLVGSLSGCCTAPRPTVHALMTPAVHSQRFDYHYEVNLYEPATSDSAAVKASLALYPQKISKTDVVYLTTGTASIEQPIMTNGGDVVIVADKVVINAPIDTRVYLSHGSDHFEGSSAKCFSANTFLSPQQYASYRLFYQASNDIWDPMQGAYIGGQAESFPEMPEGHTNCARPGAASGFSAHTSSTAKAIAPYTDAFPNERILQQSVKSGDIIIYANDISVCQGCRPPDYTWNGLKPEWLSPQHPIVDRTLLNARGLRGSRGEVNFWACSEGQTNCGPIVHHPPNLPHTGSGGAPRDGASAGGLPGYIEVGFVNNLARVAFENDPSQPPSAKALAGRMGSTPGQAGADRTIDVPCWTTGSASSPLPIPPVPGPHPNPFPGPFPGPSGGFNFHCAASTGGLDWFITTPIPTNESADTNERIIAISPDSMIYQVGSRLNAMGLARSYLYGDVLQAAQRGQYLDKLSPADQFEGFLLAVIADGDDRLLAAARQLPPQSAPAAGAIVPSFFQGLQGHYEDFPGFSPEQYALIDRLAHLSSPEYSTASPLNAYFATTGGLAITHSLDPKQQIQYTQLLQSLARVQQSIDQLAPSIQQIHMDLFENMTAMQSQDLRNKIDQLNQALADAEQKAKDAHDIFKLIPNVAKEVQKIFEDGKQAISNFYSAKPETAITPAADIVAGIGRIRDILKDNGTNPDDIKRLLGDAQNAYTAFQQSAQLARDAQLQNLQAAVDNILRDRRSVNSGILNNLVAFDDLLRNTIYQYRADQQQGTLNLNLNSISQTIRLSDATNPPFALNPMSSCSGSSFSAKIEDIASGSAHGLVECVSNGAVPSSFTLRVKPGARDTTADLPLITYTPFTNSGTVGLHAQYDAADLEVAAQPAKQIAAKR